MQIFPLYYQATFQQAYVSFENPSIVYDRGTISSHLCSHWALSLTDLCQTYLPNKKNILFSKNGISIIKINNNQNFLKLDTTE